MKIKKDLTHHLTCFVYGYVILALVLLLISSLVNLIEFIIFGKITLIHFILFAIMSYIIGLSIYKV